MEPVKVGIIGCGNISSAYVQGLRLFDFLQVWAVADLLPEAARAKAAEHDIPNVYTVEELLADPQISIVINLTIPIAHAEVSLAVIEAGKHVYSEKPLAITRADGQAILNAAAAQDVRLGCAPDTFLGGGLQTCRRLIEEGAIGQPIAATAFILTRGPESWHPNPQFFYKEGAGPLFDMGPYYITALIHLLGPVAKAAAMNRTSFPERTITSEPLYGRKVAVEVPTHVVGSLAMASGPIASVITSFDVWGHHLPLIEIHGSQGSLSVPDPNNFGGPVKLLPAGQWQWQDVPLSHSDQVRRGVGVADMALAIEKGHPHRATGEMAFHVLDIMHALYDASDQEQHIAIQSTCRQPHPLPPGLPLGRLSQ